MCGSDSKERHSEYDVTGLATLERLADAVARLSHATTNMPTTWRLEQASVAFAKVAVTCWTFLRMVPGSSYNAPVKGYAMWDLSAAATQCRSLLEAYHVLVYLIHEPLAPEERRFQQLLWNYHCESERYEMLKTALPESANVPRVAKTVAEIRGKLEADPFFLTCSPRLKKRMIAGELFKLDDNITLSRKAGISENYYRSNYKYCSAFAHTAPFSISQLRNFKAAETGANRSMKTLVGIASAYSAMALRDFSAFFPDQMLKLSPELRNIIQSWEAILLWEKSEFFRGLPS